MKSPFIVVKSQFSYGFPAFSYGFSYGFPIKSPSNHHFPMVFLGFSDAASASSGYVVFGPAQALPGARWTDTFFAPDGVFDEKRWERMKISQWYPLVICDIAIENGYL